MLNGVLGTRTQGGKMEGANESIDTMAAPQPNNHLGWNKPPSST